MAPRLRTAGVLTAPNKVLGPGFLNTNVFLYAAGGGTLGAKRNFVSTRWGDHTKLNNRQLVLVRGRNDVAGRIQMG